MSEHSILAMTDQELEDYAVKLGGLEFADEVHTEAAAYADRYPMNEDGSEPDDRAAVYRTVWRLRVTDASFRYHNTGS